MQNKLYERMLGKNKNVKCLKKWGEIFSNKDITVSSQCFLGPSLHGLMMHRIVIECEAP